MPGPLTVSIAAYLTDAYSTEGEHLLAKYPNFLAFRHDGIRKWFAVIMDISGKDLCLAVEGKNQISGRYKLWTDETMGAV